MPKSEEFTEVQVEHGDKRVTWEYIGEGESGDYDPKDPEDTPLLRFSCDRRVNPDTGIGSTGDPWEGMYDASYCTQLPTSTPLTVLLRAAGIIFEAIDTDASYKRALEGLSWFCLDDFDKADEDDERRLFAAGYGHGCSDMRVDPVIYSPAEAYDRWVENGRK